ncbi:MAG: biotin/lipoyl-binding protein [Lentisphaerae bacterium]|jgi:multidrug resistance efflux pump|nr:biotin/lipoyl-binding protein [Lentisphaerota bacterium]
MGVIRTTQGEQPPLPVVEQRSRRRRFLLIAFLVIAVVTTVGFMINIPRYTLASGYVTTREWAEVRPPVSGIVKSILVKTGADVKAGDILVELNAEVEEANLSEAQTVLQRLKANRERRKAEMAIDIDRRTVTLNEEKRLNQENIAKAELELSTAQTNLKLTRELVEKGLKAASNLENDSAKEKLAQLNLKILKEKDFTPFEQLIAKDAEKYVTELTANQKEIEAQIERIKRLEAVIETRKIRAPIDGNVVRYTFVPGELLQPSSVIYEIFDGAPQLKLRVQERYASRVAVGQDYRAEVSSHKGIRNFYFYGKVEYLRNVIQADGATTYRVAYCSFDPKGFDITMGTTCEARIYYGKSAFWFYLFGLDW